MSTSTSLLCLLTFGTAVAAYPWKYDHASPSAQQSLLPTPGPVRAQPSSKAETSRALRSPAPTVNGNYPYELDSDPELISSLEDGTITATAKFTIRTSSVSFHNQSTSSTLLPTPVNGALVYPDPTDCGALANDYEAPAWKRWADANATDTLSCFKSVIEEVPSKAGQGSSYDFALAQYYGETSPVFDCGIDPSVGTENCQVTDWTCQNLVPTPVQAPSNSTVDVAGLGCDPGDPNLHQRYTGRLVLESMVNYNKYLTAVYTAIDASISNVNDILGPNGQFTKDFAPPPPDNVTPTRIGLAVLTAMLGIATGGVGFLTIGASEAAIATGSFLGATAYSVGGGAAAISMAGASVPTNNPDLQDWYGNMTHMKGFVTIPPTKTTGPYNITLLDQFSNGTWLGNKNFTGGYDASVTLTQQALVAQLAQKSWVDADGLYPFINVSPGDCTDINKFPNSMVSHEINGQITYPDVSTVIDGICYSLLGAKEGSCGSQSVNDESFVPRSGNITGVEDADRPGPLGNPNGQNCCGYDVLPGGNVQVLSGTNQNYFGLKLSDMIASAVSGWQLNHKANGYEMWNLTDGFATIGFPKNISSTGIVNLLPVCDYSKPHAPGSGCPKILSDSSSCSTF